MVFEVLTFLCSRYFKKIFWKFLLSFGTKFNSLIETTLKEDGGQPKQKVVVLVPLAHSTFLYHKKSISTKYLEHRIGSWRDWKIDEKNGIIFSRFFCNFIRESYFGFCNLIQNRKTSIKRYFEKIIIFLKLYKPLVVQNHN